MIKKVSELSTATYLAFTSFVQNLKDDERGLSGIVVAILLILLAVILIAIFWVPLSNLIQNLWDRITETTDGFQ